MENTATKSVTAPVEIARRGPSSRWALAGLSLSMLLSSLGTSVGNVILPTLAQVFDATFQEVQWIVLAYLLTLTALIVSVGRLGDIFGRRRLLLLGILVFTSASILCGFSPSLDLLIVARAVQGLGAAAMMALTLAFVGSTVPKDQTGRAMGLLGTMSAVGTALGPSLAGILMAASGWRATFLVNVPFGVAALLLVRRNLPADRPHGEIVRHGFDAVGTLLLALALAAYAFAMTYGRGQVSLFNLALLAVAAGTTVLFLFYQSKAAAPLIHLALLRDGALRAGLLTSGLVSTVMMTTLVVGPFYLSLALNLESTVVGLVLSIGPLVAALAGVPAGRMADQLGTDRVVLIGLIGMATGSLVLASLPSSLGITGYLAPIVGITLSYALFQTANNSAVMGSVPANERGVVSGMLNLARNLGLITGASVMGSVFARAARTTDLSIASPTAIATGMRITFGLAAILIVFALIIATNVTRSNPYHHRHLD